VVDLPPLTEYTIEAWVYRETDSQGYESFISDANSGYSQVWATLYIDGGNGDCGGAADQFSMWDGQTAHCSGVTAELGTWYHVAVSRQSDGTLRYFVDGQLVNIQGSSIANDSDGQLSFGRAGDFSDEYFPGLLDEIRISDVARYTTAFTPQTRLTADADTIGLWNFDEGSGQIAGDSSGNGRDGTLNGGVSWSGNTP